MLLKLTGGPLQAQLQKLLATLAHQLLQAQVILLPEKLQLFLMLAHAPTSAASDPSRTTKRVLTGSL